MRPLLLAVVGTLLLTGCSGRDEAPAPPATPPVPTRAVTQGPATGPTVPLGAFLKPGELGTGWRNALPAPLPCAPAFRRTAVRSVGFQDARGTLTETIATGVDLTRAARAWRASLQGCGYRVVDEALGDAGLRATARDGAEAVLATGTEGVLVVMHARGRLVPAEELDAWADLALGTSCVAAPDGCH